MTVRSVPFAKLIVRDMPAMVAFYERAFGFAVRRRVELPALEEVLMQVGDDAFTLVLYRHTDGRAADVGSAHGPVGLATDDIEADRAAALAAGATATDPIQEFPGLRFAFVDDPEGHALELIQYVRDETREGAR